MVQNFLASYVTSSTGAYCNSGWNGTRNDINSSKEVNYRERGNHLESTCVSLVGPAGIARDDCTSHFSTLRLLTKGRWPKDLGHALVLIRQRLLLSAVFVFHSLSFSCFANNCIKDQPHN